MRGAAVLLAAGSVWIAVAGWTPGIDLRWPSISVRDAARSAFAAIVVGLASAAVTGIVSIGIACGVLGGLVPAARGARRAGDERWARQRQWPDILAHVRGGLASGGTLADSLMDALERAGDDYRAMSEVIRRETVFGGGLDTAVAEIRSEGADPFTHRILATLANAARTGGHRVGDIVATLGRAVGDDIRLREAHNAAMSEQRMTVSVALVAPWVMLVLAVVTNPQAAEAFASTEGSLVIAIGAAATGVGWVLSVRTTRLSGPPEVFR